MGSSLKFLRKTGWARAQVEAIYLEDQRVIARNAKRNRRRAERRAHRAEHEEQARDDTERASAEDTVEGQDDPASAHPVPRRAR